VKRIRANFDLICRASDKSAEAAGPRVVNLKKSAKSVKEAQKKTSRKGIGGLGVVEKENREGMFEAFSKLGESVFSLEGAKKAAAWYIETSERFAHQALELQEKATGWAKETPLAPLFEAQHNLARKLIERSATAARNLWQVPANN
jgi:hypothetical protein